MNEYEIIIMETSEGIIEIEIDFRNAPITSANFKEYVENGFYDGTVFHRVIEGFMIQGGGFTKEGDLKEPREPIKLESNNGLKNNNGSIAMARTSDPNSATSQFFINTANNDFLNYADGNPGYAVFGKVVSGMEVVKKIEAVETDTREMFALEFENWPIEDVIIIRAYIKEN
jgi:cyclophilin family peptidyl-prolyl cis-trans isomerase